MQAAGILEKHALLATSTEQTDVRKGSADVGREESAPKANDAKRGSVFAMSFPATDAVPAMFAMMEQLRMLADLAAPHALTVLVMTPANRAFAAAAPAQPGAALKPDVTSHSAILKAAGPTEHPVRPVISSAPTGVRISTEHAPVAREAQRPATWVNDAKMATASAIPTHAQPDVAKMTNASSPASRLALQAAMHACPAMRISPTIAPLPESAVAERGPSAAMVNDAKAESASATAQAAQTDVAQEMCANHAPLQHVEQTEIFA